MTDSQDFGPGSTEPTEAMTRRAMREADRKKPSRASKPAGDPAAATATSAGAAAIVGGAESAAGKRGLAAVVAKHPTAWLSSVLAVVFLLLGTGAVFAGAAVGSGEPAAVVTPTPTVTQEPPRTVPEAVPAASRLRTCSIAALAADPRLEVLSATVMNATTGEVLFDRNGDKHSRTASVLKVITAAAAISALGPDGRLSTKVVDAGPGSIALVGGGDATLATTSNTFYNGAPRIQDLASAAKAAYEAKYPDVPITEIILDATMWDPSDNWESTWNPDQRPKGHQPFITALMVDGDRRNPASVASPRGDDPIGTAGRAFASALGVGDVEFTRANAGGGELLAEVKSQPVSTLVKQMLPSSDNTIGEMLARVSAKALGYDGTTKSLADAIPEALEKYGVDASGIWISDGSGLSTANAVSPKFVSELMVKVMNGDNGLAVVRDAMPIAGKNGTLSSRFSGDNAVARGAITAKTGWLRSAYTLGGFMTAQDGTKLTFAIYATRDGISEDAKQAIDTLATGAYRCGDNLSNN